MNVSVVLFTADLRVHDHPPLLAAHEADEVVPLFVRDRAVADCGFAAPNRLAFLADSLRDLDNALRERGGRLIVRSGDIVDEVCKVVAETDAGEVHMAGDVSAYAHLRERRLRRALESQGRRLHVHDTVTTAVAPGEVTPASSDHFAVFTPYFRQWSKVHQRDPLAAPRTVRVPDGGTGSETLPSRSGVPGLSEGLAAGGEAEGRKRLTAWLRGGIGTYEDRHDDLAGDATSRLSSHLHFGTLSPSNWSTGHEGRAVRAARPSSGRSPGATSTVRSWPPGPARRASDYRTKHDRWRSGREAREDVEAWQEGRTGYPVVDAAMRQLRYEGWMHNRGRLLTASFLTKTLYVDWRVGARHFLDLLVDGDIANNQMNWQWMAGTGTDSRPNRVLNPVTQGRRYDPDGAYVRRWVPELAGIDGPAVHEPWKQRGLDRAGLDDYPDPIVELSEGLTRFRQARGRD